MIRKEYRYFLSGECQVQYKTLQEAIDSAESRVEEFFRKPLRQKLSAKEWSNFIDFVLCNKEHIRQLLDFSADPYQFNTDGD